MKQIKVLIYVIKIKFMKIHEKNNIIKIREQ